MEQMMGQIHVWQMVVDLFLVSSILIFTFRWVKGDRAQALVPKTMELEASLRSLILEADGAGRHLNDQLLKREQSLQKLLDDITAADQKIQRAVASGEERSIYLEKEEEKARVLIGELQGVLREFREQLQNEASREEEILPAAPQTSSHKQSVQMQKPAPQRQPPRPYAPQETFARETEYAEVAPSQSVSQRTTRSYSEAAPTQLAAQAATQMVYRDKMGHQELQQVYAAAESMLKQGQELSQVSAQTRLPVEEIQLLSQMIEVEREELSRQSAKPTKQAEQSGDTRLGALGAIRRHNATL